MKIECPRGWKTSYQIGDPKLGRITVHHNKVEILEGICNSCDLCGIKNCRFYDNSAEATRRFVQASIRREHTLEGLLWQMQEDELQKEREVSQLS